MTIAGGSPTFLVEQPFEQVKLDLDHQVVGAVLVRAGGSYGWPTRPMVSISPGYGMQSTSSQQLIHQAGSATVRTPARDYARGRQ